MESDVWQRLRGGCFLHGAGGLGAARVLQGCHTDEVNLAEHFGSRQRSPPRPESSSTLADHDRGAETPGTTAGGTI